MKTSLLSSRVFCNVLFTFLLFGVNHFVSAQCPTINNTNPVICADGAGYTFKDLDVYVTDLGNGIAWYDAATGGVSYNPNELVIEGTYYAGDTTGGCGTRFSIFVDFAVNDIGQTLDRIYCSKENATFQNYIDDELDVFIPIGGSVTIYTDLELTNAVNPLDIIPIGAATYFMVFEDSGVCIGQIERGQIGVFSTPADPTPESEQLFCSGSNPTVADLNTNTSSFVNWYESLDSAGNPILPALLTTDPLIDGQTYYVQIEGVFCSSNPVSVLVEINTEESGVSNILRYCENNLPVSDFNLFDFLGNPKDATGTWTGPEPTSNDHLGTVNISTLVVGSYVFSYTVPANGTCPDLISEISIEIDEALSSGTAISPNPITFCTASLPAALDLSALITGQDPGGQWTSGPLSTDPVVTSPVDLTTFGQGTYYYTYTQNLSPNVCNEQSTIIQVDILSDPSAGIAVNQIFCENNLLPNSPFDLFMALDGTQSNNNGVWRDESNNTVSNLIDITGFTFISSPYNYSYMVGEGSCSATETITISIDEAPESGTANPPAEYCEATAPVNFDLFSLLTGADLTGTWYVGPDNLGATTSNTIDLSGLILGAYNYTYQVTPIGTCTDDFVTVQVNINPLPNAGTASPAIFCENDLAANSPLDLFGQLTGQDSGGVWTDDNTSGALTINSVDLTVLSIGLYNYTYTITDGSGCENSVTVSVEVQDSPESGTVNPPAEYCEGIGPVDFDLFSLLTGADLNGTWYVGTDNLGATTSNTIDLSGFILGTYNYTYQVTPIGTCTDDLVTVQVNINPSPNAGTPSPALFCENDLAANSPLDLFGQLAGQDSGGTWTDDNTSGALTGNNLDLTVLSIGLYNYTYTITNGNGCESSATVLIEVQDSPESGTVNPPAEYCEGIGPVDFDLFSLLTGADIIGTWYVGTDNLGATTSNILDLSGFISGAYNYTYQVTPVGTCTDELVTVQININPSPNTGIPSPAIFCENDLIANSPLDLFGQLTGQDLGGTWTDDNASGALTGSNVDLTVLAIGIYNYTYTISDSGGCENSSTVSVEIQDGPSSGEANSPAEFCLVDITSGQTYDLFNLLTGADQPGVWSDDDSTGTLTGSIMSLDGLIVGIYNFTYTVDPVGSCVDTGVTVSVIINDVEAPTADSNQLFCDSATITDLIATGSDFNWYDVETGGIALDATTALMDGQTYYVSQTDAVTGCESSLRIGVTATIYQSPNAGVAAPFAACNTDNNVDLFNGLDGTEDAGGTWQNNDGVGTLAGNIFDATGVAVGSYEFTYVVLASAPCVDAETTITVDVELPLSAGTDNILDVCSDNGTTDLFTLLGSADTGGTWSPELTSGTGVFDPLLDADGIYTYSVTNSCGSDTSEVVITVSIAPDAGEDNTASLCVIDGSTDLFELLGPTAQTGGLWTPVLTSGSGIFNPTVDAEGVYTYTVTSALPCVLEVSAEITVLVNDTPAIIVLNPNPEYCLGDSPSVEELSTSIRPTGIVNWYEDPALTLPLVDSDELVDGEDYYATQIGESGCESSVAVQINVTINDTPPPTIKDSSVDYCINDGPTIDDLSLNIDEYDESLNNVVWYDAETGGNAYDSTSTLSNLTYYATIIDANSGCESSMRLAVSPDVTACGKVKIPDGFSPNGDGVNDTLDIDFLTLLYPDFTIEIYNRYGNIVYKGAANTPRFDGTANQSKVVFDGDLPVGVYFYIFNFNDGENAPEQGRIYLSR